MHTASSAKRTCSARASASECTATVLIAELAAGADDAQRDLAAVGDEDLLNIARPGPARRAQAFLMRKSFCPNSTALAVLREDLDDRAGALGLDLVHQLHRLDDAERLPGAHDRADLDERRRVGGGRAVERADEGARHVDRVGRPARSRSARRRGPRPRLRQRPGRQRPRAAVVHRDRARAADDADARAVVLVLELGDVLLRRAGRSSARSFSRSRLMGCEHVKPERPRWEAIVRRARRESLTHANGVARGTRRARRARARSCRRRTRRRAPTHARAIARA